MRTHADVCAQEVALDENFELPEYLLTETERARIERLRNATKVELKASYTSSLRPHTLVVSYTSSKSLPSTTNGARAHRAPPQRHKGSALIEP
jgi:hypothetical protein